MNASLVWKEKMVFECDNRGLKNKLDAVPEHGGTNAGPTPKELVLNAMMGCTAIDVVSILNKMRQEIVEFRIDIEAEKTTEHPVHFKTAVLKFLVKGNIQSDKLIKAIDSSLTKYCGVNYMISKTCDIGFEAYLNGEKIHQGKVTFKL